MYRRSLAISSVRYFTLFYAKTQTFMLNMFFYIRIMVTVICQNITTIEKWVDWPPLYWPTHAHSHRHIEQEKHFTFAKSFIWKFFWLCFRHVSSSCQCQHLLLARLPTTQTLARMIWMCRFYTSRPYFPMYWPSPWPSAAPADVQMNGICFLHKMLLLHWIASQINRYFLSSI